MHFRSNGKLLLTSEYAIMDGAVGLALPLHYGQSLEIIADGSRKLTWQSLDKYGRVWFEDVFLLDDINRTRHIIFNNEISQRLYTLLCFAKSKNPYFLDNGGVKIVTRLDFPGHWGLGTSSTLVNNIAQWAGVDAFDLLWSAFKGSGYDIACAQNKTPITYQLQNRKIPMVKSTNFFPKFHDSLHFIYSNNKQDTQKAIKRYKTKYERTPKALVNILSKITKEVLVCTDIHSFETLIKQHEQLLGSHMGTPTLKQNHFSDYSGQIKSLGAWGGDFFLVTGESDEVLRYFRPKGYDEIFSFSEMVLVG